MKKTALATVLLSIFIMGIAYAEPISLPELLGKLPDINSAVIYNVNDGEFSYASTFSLVKLFKDKVNIDIGWSPKQEVLAAATFKLVEVKDYIQFQILKYIVIEPGVYIGVDRIGIGPGNAKENNEVS